jgi:hypothetical protein
MSASAFPTAVSWGYPHLEVFAASSNQSVYWKYRGLNTKDTTWHPTDGTLTPLSAHTSSFYKSITALSRGVDNIDLFAVDDEYNTCDMASNHTASNTTWSPWEYQGLCGIRSSFAAVSWDEDHIDRFSLFGQWSDTGFYLQDMTWNSTSNQWTYGNRVGGYFEQITPTVVSWAQGRLDVFVVNTTTKSLLHQYFNGSVWLPNNTFEDLGGYCTSRPAAVSRRTGQLDVFVRGGDAGLWHLSFGNNSWSNWTSVSGNMSVQAEPDAVSWSEDRIDIFAWDAADQALLHKSFDGVKGIWSPPDGFENLGGQLGGPPKAVNDVVGSVHVFAFDRYGAVIHRGYNESVNAWSPSSGFETLGTP